MSPKLSPKTPAQRAGERWLLVFFVCALVGAGTGARALLDRWSTPPAIQIVAPPTAIATPLPLPTTTYAPAAPAASIMVMVSGAVRQPGMVELPAGATVADALSSAGGLSDQADPATIDPAQLLVDGSVVTVLALSDPSNTATQLINLNLATAAELESLPGIGPQFAQAIIEHRPYRHLSDLNRVPGIGEATINRLRGLVTVE